jgi:hypothetical protein
LSICSIVLFVVQSLAKTEQVDIIRWRFRRSDC